MKAPLIYIPVLLVLAATGWIVLRYNAQATDYEILQLKAAQKEIQKQKIARELKEVQATLSEHNSVEAYKMSQENLQNELQTLNSTLSNQPDYAAELLKLEQKKEELEKKIREREQTSSS